MSRDRLPSVPGFPGVALPPVDSRPPPMSTEGEALYRAILSVQKDVHDQGKEHSEQIAGVHKRIDQLSAEVVHGAHVDVEHATAIANLSTEHGKKAGGHAGRFWGAIAGPLATGIAGALLALALAGLHACGYDVPQPVLEVRSQGAE